MTRKYVQLIVAATLVTLFGLAGCRSSTPPVEFYTLSPMAAVSEEDKVAGLGDNIAVGVGPLQIPKVIDRPQMVTRIGPNRIYVDEFHRWAGSVYEDFLRVVTMNLSTLLNSSLVVAYPWEDYYEPDYRVFLDAHRFDGFPGRFVQLDISWTITDRDARRILLVHKTTLREPTRGEDFEAFVAAKSRILATLSRHIGRGIKEVHGVK